MLKKFLYIIIAIVGGFFSGYLLLTFIVLGGTTQVPDLIGKDIVVANKILREKGLYIRIEGYEYSETPTGTVSNQNPPAGTKIKSGREIGVIVSKGLRFNILPDVTGINYEEAEKILNEKGITIEQIIYIHSEIYPEKTVIAQRPEPNEGGKSIKLLVSKGRRED